MDNIGFTRKRRGRILVKIYEKLKIPITFKSIVFINWEMCC